MYLPDVAEVIARDHARFEGRVQDFTTLADETVNATGAAQRTRLEQLYMELASFTGAYLAHQNIEERVVMPALERALGVDGCFAIHAAIVSAIPPDQMAKGLAVMLPAMNIDDLAEVLGGMQQQRAGRGVRGRVGSRGLGAARGRARRARRSPRAVVTRERARRDQLLQDPFDERVGVFHLTDRLLAELLRQALVSPVRAYLRVRAHTRPMSASSVAPSAIASRTRESVTARQ